VHLTDAKVSTVELMLDLGADKMLKGKRGTYVGTALDWARKKGNKDIVALLEGPTGTLAFFGNLLKIRYCLLFRNPPRQEGRRGRSYIPA
jgi:hypothetical protein